MRVHARGMQQCVPYPVVSMHFTLVSLASNVLFIYMQALAAASVRPIVEKADLWSHLASVKSRLEVSSFVDVCFVCSASPSPVAEFMPSMLTTYG